MSQRDSDLGTGAAEKGAGERGAAAGGAAQSPSGQDPHRPLVPGDKSVAPSPAATALPPLPVPPSPRPEEAATIVTPRPGTVQPGGVQPGTVQPVAGRPGLPTPAVGEGPTMVTPVPAGPAPTGPAPTGHAPIGYGTGQAPTGAPPVQPSGASPDERTTKIPPALSQAGAAQAQKTHSPAYGTVAQGATVATPSSVVSPPAGASSVGSVPYARPFSQGGAPTGPGSQTASSGPLPVHALIAGRYRVQKVLGIGGMGEVYHVVDEVLEIEVALKVMRSEMASDPSFLQRFRNELLVARQISHPNVVRIHDIGQDGSLLFMTMDLVRGRSLGDVMRGGPMNTKRAVAIIRQVADALSVAHSKNVVHRDLKPANILIDEAGDAFVTDFGIAHSHHFSGLTRTGEVLGTPDYLAPEQARGELVDGRADIYALGLMFFEMVTGERPFTGGTLVEILAQHMNGQTRSFQDVAVQIDPGIQAVIRRCMETKAADRYPEAQALIEDLDDLDRPLRRAQAEQRRRRFQKARKVAIAAVAVVVLAAGGYWAFDRLRPDPAAPPVVEQAAALEALPTLLVLPMPEDGDSELSDRDAWASYGLPELLARSAVAGGAAQVPSRARVDSVLRDLDFSLDRLGDAELSQLADLFGADHVLFGRLDDDGESWKLSLQKYGSAGIEDVFEGAAVPAEIGPVVSEAVATVGRTLAPTAAASPFPALDLPVDVAAAYFRGRLKTARQDPSAELDLNQVVEAAPEFAPGRFARADLLSKMGRGSEAEGDLTEALRLWQEAGAPDPDRPRAEVLAASMAGDADAAVAALGSWVEARQGDLEARFELANLFGDVGRLDQAIETLETARRLDPADHRVWYFLGRYSIVAGDPGRAVDDFLVEALSQARRVDDRAAQAQISNALGIGYQHLGKPEQAGRRYADAGELYEQVGDRNGYAKAQLNLGRLSTSAGRFAEAETQLQNALATFEEIGNTAGQTDAVNDTGVLWERQGRYDEALDYYRQALRLRLDAGDRLKAAESYHNVGYVHLNMANYSDAVLNLEQALGIYGELSNTYGTMVVQQTRAGVHMARGDWDEAAKDLSSALTTSRELQTPLVGAASHGELARLAAAQGRYAEALDGVDKALAVVEEQKNPSGQVEFSLVKAETLLRLGAVDAATPLLDTADRVLAEAENPPQRADLSRLRGRAAELSGDGAGAAQHYAEAVSHAEAGHNLAARWRARAAAAFDGSPAAVEALLAEARRLGSPPLELALEETLGRAYLRSGDSAGAVTTLRRALSTAEKVPGYGRIFVLRALLAAALEKAADPGTAAALDAAAQARDEARGNVPEAHQATFDALSFT